MTLNKDGLEAALLPCPFCGGPARRIEYNGTDQATCAGGYSECAGSDIVAPVAMWNRRAEAAESEVLRLTEEAARLDRILRASIPEPFKSAVSPVGAAQGYIAALETRIKALEEALRPFARVGDIFELRAGNRPNSDDDPVTEWEDHRVGARRLTVGDFRRARLLLKEGGGE